MGGDRSGGLLVGELRLGARVLGGVNFRLTFGLAACSGDPSLLDTNSTAIAVQREVAAYSFEQYVPMLSELATSLRIERDDWRIGRSAPDVVGFLVRFENNSENAANGYIWKHLEKSLALPP
jgi:hypothetical protein